MVNRQARFAGGGYPWVSYGDVSFIEAARRHAKDADTPENWGGSPFWESSEPTIKIEVRGKGEDDIPPAMFEVKRVLSYEVTNPRLGA